MLRPFHIISPLHLPRVTSEKAPLNVQMSTDLSQRSSSRIQDDTAAQEQRTKEAKEAFLATLKDSGSKLDSELHTRAKLIHTDAQKLKKQDQQVQKSTKQLTKEGDGLEKFLSKSRKSLPDMDSFEADIAKLEEELDIFDEMMDKVEQRDVREEDDELPGQDLRTFDSASKEHPKDRTSSDGREPCSFKTRSSPPDGA